MDLNLCQIIDDPIGCDYNYMDNVVYGNFNNVKIKEASSCFVKKFSYLIFLNKSIKIYKSRPKHGFLDFSEWKKICIR